MLALLVTALLAQASETRIIRPERLTGSRESGRAGVQALAFFEFAPASGRGMPAACSTTAPTGAKGEALTFTRASSATCTRTASGGLATTGIANGDLVTLASNQSRVMYDSAGVLGLLVESSRTNSVLRSQELDNAAWSITANVGGFASTANYASAPDGTMTAERLQFPATNATTQYSILGQVGMPLVASTLSVYVRGTSGSGTTCLVGTGAPNFAALCPFVSTSWTLCRVSGTLSGTGSVYIGNDSAEASVCNVNMSASDVLVWGFQVEAGTYATSYIPTTTAAVTRSVEAAGLPGAAFPVSPVSFAASITVPWSGTSTPADIITGNVGSNSGWSFGWTGATLRSQPCTGGACATLDVVSGPTALVAARWAVSYSGTQTTLFKDAVTIAGPAVKAAPNSPWATNTTLGSGAGWGSLDGIVSRICVDPDPTRCR